MRRIAVNGAEYSELTDGWLVAGTAPGEHATPPGAELDWVPAQVPGTVAASRAAWSDDELDGRDWWFRTSFEGAPDEPAVLGLDGIATIAEVYLNGALLLRSQSMFAAHAIETRLQATNQLDICCRALGPLLAAPRKPRARWRTRLVSDGNLRFYRTMLLGRAPGFAPGPAVVGPWRPVWLARPGATAVDELRLRPRVLADGGGLLEVSGRLRSSEATAARVTAGEHAAELTLDGDALTGELLIPEVERWWPHTHGEPTLYEVGLQIELGGDVLKAGAGRIGFRSLDTGNELEHDGIRLRVNDVDVFARGAVWTPPSLERPHATEGELRPILERVRAAGMNMLRIPGPGCYESTTFHDLCDELGILVWQDFMFANLDYPESDDEFMATVRAEARAVLGELGGRPSLAVLCGGSEVAQQVAMMGLDPQLANGPLFGELLPELVREAGVDAAYIPSTPWGGELPFRTDRGVAHYFGVGAYRQDFTDTRRAEVKFAAECLAISNVPDDEPEVPVHHPGWKSGVPRDTGAGWDFEDVRDHYLHRLYGLDPVDLRWSDHERYLELSRAVSGEVMAEVFGEWRRAASCCGGGLVLWLRDVLPGAGWGILDHRAEPKAAYHHLRRALAPIAVWTTDEGLGGVVAHVANDRPEPLKARLRVAMYRDMETVVAEACRDLELAAHQTHAHNVEGVLGRFVDAAWTYRFGPPAQDLIVVSLEADERVRGKDAGLLSQAFRYPTGRPALREAGPRLGLRAVATAGGGGEAWVTVSSTRHAYGVRLHLPGYRPDDDAFSIEPGHCRRIGLQRIDPAVPEPAGSLSAVNLLGRVPIEVTSA